MRRDGRAACHCCTARLPPAPRKPCRTLPDLPSSGDAVAHRPVGTDRLPAPRNPTEAAHPMPRTTENQRSSYLYLGLAGETGPGRVVDSGLFRLADGANEWEKLRHGLPEMPA